MAIDKSLDRGLGALDEELNPGGKLVTVDDIEVEVEPDGGVVIQLRETKDDTEIDFGDNLADHLEEEYLNKLCDDLTEDFDTDLASRADWVKSYIDGLEYLGLKYEERSEPWENACGVYHPMLAEAVVRFQSEAMSETFPAKGPVKAEVKGKETKENAAAAQRVAEDMNYKLIDEMVEYRQEHERLLWSLPLAGSAFKKVYYDELLGRPTAVFVAAEDLVMPFGASSLETAERVTHVMRRTHNELVKLIDAEFYSDIDLKEPDGTLDSLEQEKLDATAQGFEAVDDDRHKVLEMQVELDLEGFEDKKKGKPTGIALPYVVTLLPSQQKILSIRRNYREDDPKKLKLQHFAQYTYVPGFGVYGLGLLHLIGGFVRAATSLTRQLVDAGTLSNLPGGLKTRGMRIKGDDTPISPGEWRDADVPAGVLRDNIFPLPYKEPSPTLYQLLGDMVNEGKSFINASDLNVSDMSAQAPVGTTLAILERQLKVMGAIQARLHFSMKQEFKLLKKIIRDSDDDSYAYAVEGEEPAVKQADYDMCEIVPVSDPNASTMAQKVIQYQTVMQMAAQAPGIYDMSMLHRQMIDVLGIKNADKLVPVEDDLKNTDPVTENMKLLRAEPVKAFLVQDHQSHIQSHMAFMQDPKIQSIAENDPMVQQKMAAMYAHISEHVAFEYRKQIEAQMGIQLPPEDEELPPEIEVSLSKMAAEAGSRLLQQNQGEMAQKAAEAAQQDPMVQMQQKELEQRDREIALKEGELQLKAQQAQVDARDRADKSRLKEQEIASKEAIAEAQLGANVQAEESKNELEVMKFLADDQHRDEDRESQEQAVGTKILADQQNKRLDSEERSRSAQLMSRQKPKPKGKE